VSGRRAILLVARRELRERVRERSFLLSTGVTVAIVALVVLLPTVLGFGGPSKFTIAATDAQGAAVARQAQSLAGAFDVKLTVKPRPPADATIGAGTIRAAKEPDDTLLNLLQVANRQLDARARPPLRLVTATPVDPERDKKSGTAFVAVLVLYGQLLTYGFWVASGVVEEKSSRVIELLLAAIRPQQLLAGKVLGLGLLGLGQLLLVAAFGVITAGVSGALDVNAALVGTVALSLGWFVLGYAFYASAFAVAGALVPRVEELQSTTTPLTMTIVVSLLLGFAVNQKPDGTLAHVTAFLPTTAPITMPSRMILGAAPAWEVVASAAITILATLALIPLAGRIYAAVVLRTGSAVKLSEALRLARRA
jgi:ABC-2 type transport system permease protein